VTSVPAGIATGTAAKRKHIMHGHPLSCVLLADRHHGLAEGMRSLLETAFETVVMVADEASLLEGAGRLRPEVAVVDLSLARDSNLSWLRALRERSPELGIIVLSLHDEDAVRRAVMEAGADAFVLKRAVATDLLPAVDAVRRRALEAGQTPGTGASP
jgi:DNA-binding NarL/FixJ family response regulator